MKRILVPCDFSNPAQEAYKFAVQIASARRGEIVVLKVIEMPMTYESAFGLPVYTFDSGFVETMKKDTLLRFEKLRELYGTGSCTVHFETEYGHVPSTIQAFTESKKIDLVIMGTHGSRGWEEYLIGSNTEKIVRRSAVPVMALRTAKDISSIKNIVFPTTLALNKDELVTKIKALQKFFGAKLHILFVNTPTHFTRDAEIQKKLEAFARNYELDNYTLNIRNDTHEQDGIVQFAVETGADMIAMGTHGRRGLAHLFTGSIAEDVVNHVDCAIWTYRMPALT